VIRHDMGLRVLAGLPVEFGTITWDFSWNWWPLRIMQNGVICQL
jgi:hypothetical protein